MKNNMQIINRRKFLVIAILAGLLVPGVTIAAPLGPDLRAGIKVTDAVRNSNGTYNFTIRATVKNVGAIKFISRAGQQNLSLYEGRSSFIQSWGFTRVIPGQTLNFSKAFRNISGGEFVPSYSVRLNFGPDIYQDENKYNDEVNRNNNKAALSRNTLSNTFAAADSRARGQKTINKYKLQPQNKNILPQQNYKFKP